MIKFYNTKTRKREEFKPIEEGKVGLYTCGPTVYDFAHIGNFRAYIFEDLLRRFLSLSGFEVYHVMNITDIDDKTIRRSIEENRSLQDFTDEYVKSFHEDVATLRLLPAHEYPRATEFIPQMLDMVGQLEKKGFTYTTQDGSVFFKISEFDGYGSLAKLDPDQLRSGERVENDEYGKEEGRDFALWKGHKDSESNISWESPWGNGRPGWHLECSAMSTYYLGNHFDIHCGGVDNIFPHHENEIAQSCGGCNENKNPKKYVKYWIHNSLINMEGEKMSKSLGNILYVHDLVKKYPGEVLRLALLSTHYRQPLNWNSSIIEQCQSILDRLYRTLHSSNCLTQEGSLDSEILEALCDDLNTSKALAEINSIANQLSKAKTNQDRIHLKSRLLESANLLGILQQNPAKWLGYLSSEESVDEKLIQKLIDKRNKARTDKNFDLADDIRRELNNMNIEIEDTPDGTIWRNKK